jgi:hypothetical protein
MEILLMSLDIGNCLKYFGFELSIFFLIPFGGILIIFSSVVAE